jgi:hypothetical protein
MLSEKQEQEMAMGMFRTGNGWAQVDYDGNNILIPRSKYEENGYKPDFDKLPLEADCWAAQAAKNDNIKGPKSRSRRARRRSTLVLLNDNGSRTRRSQHSAPS